MKSDKMFEELGYTKILDDGNNFVYERELSTFSHRFSQIIEISNVTNALMIFSYKKDQFGEVCDYHNMGIDLQELEAIYQKIKEIKEGIKNV